MPESLLDELPLAAPPRSLGDTVRSGLKLRDLQPLLRRPVLDLAFPLDACVVPPGATVIGFDDLDHDVAVTEQHRDLGVRFVAETPGGLRVADGALGTISAPNVLTNSDHDSYGSRFGIDTAVGDIAVMFTRPQTDVGVFVGLTGPSTEPVTALMTAVDADGEVVASDTTVLAAGDVPVRQCLRVQQLDGAAAAIAGVRVEYDPPLPEVIDDLFFSASLPQPDVRDLGAIRFLRPTDGATLHTDAVVVSGEVFGTTPVDSVRVIWRCDNPPPEPDATYWSSVSWGQLHAELHPDPRNPLRSLWVTAPSRIDARPCGADTDVRLTASATFDGFWTIDDEITVRHVSPRLLDDVGAPVAIRGIEPTQGVRSSALPVVADATYVTDPMQHVAGRPMVLRVYPELLDGINGDRSEPLHLRATAFDTTSRSVFPAPATIENDGLRLTDELGSLDVQRRSVDGGWNVRVPDAWTRPGRTTVVLTAYPEGVDPSTYDACRCAERPHTVRVELTFAPSGSVELHMFAVEHTTTDATGATTVAPFPSPGALDEVLAQAYRYLPIARGNIRVAGLDTVRWSGPTSTEDEDGTVRYPFEDAMRRRHLAPDGVTGTGAHNRGTMFGFYFDGAAGCRGRGWLDASIFLAGACSGASVPTHQALHTLGLDHAGNQHSESDGGGFDRSYPGACGQVSAAAGGGLDGRTIGLDATRRPVELLLPDAPSGPATPGESGSCGDRHLHDLLSHGWGQDWISPYTWSNVTARTSGPSVTVSGTDAGALTPAPSDAASEPATTPPAPAPAPASDAESVVVQLFIGEADVELLGSILADALPSTEESPVVVRALAGDGSLVREQPVSLHAPESGEPTRTGSAMVVLPRDGWSTLEVHRDGALVGRLRPNLVPVTVTLIAPTGSTSIGATPVEVAWSTVATAVDSVVQLRAGSERWRTVAGTTGDRVELTAAELGTAAGPAELRVQVNTADGGAGVSRTLPVTVGASPPLVLLHAPRDGATVRTGELLELAGEAVAPGGTAVEDAALDWFVDDERVGGGATWAAPDLEDGEHTIELRATVAGATATTQVTVVVGTDSDGDGLLDEVETEIGLDPQDPSDALADPDEDTLDTRSELRAGTDPFAADSDGDGYGDAIELMAGSDPLDDDSLPGPMHGFDGEWPRVTAAAVGEAEAAGLPWSWIAVVIALLLGAAGLVWRRRRGQDELPVIG